MSTLTDLLHRPQGRAGPVAQRAVAGARVVADLAMALAFPLLCLGCDRRLQPVAAGALPLCPSCLRGLPRAGPDAAEARMARLPADVPRPARTLALWTFDSGGTIRRLQHALKYDGRPALGVELGALVGRALSEFWAGASYDRVVAVPLARSRLLERGYNQAEVLARGVAAGIALIEPIAGAHSTNGDTVLVRGRATSSQTRLTRESRRSNVAGAFSLAPGEGRSVAGRRLLLVDDVLTTGATLSAAAAPLLAAGASVDAVVMACVAE